MDKSWVDLIPETEMIQWRRHLHRHPERSFHEEKTCAYIIKKLQSFGNIEIEQPTATSVLGTIQGQQPGKKILIRADIDALPVQEDTGMEFASENPGLMHACGHDTHTAILLATAQVLVKLREQFSGTVQVLFQHAEELPPGGAREIVASGYLHDLDAAIGLHIMSMAPTGSIQIVPEGAWSTYSDTLELTIHGRGSHGTMPQNGVDPIIVGTEIVNQFQTVISRFAAPDDVVVINVGEFQAGHAANVIPETAHLSASIRTIDQQTREKVAQRIQDIVKNTCATYGATPEMEYDFYYDAVMNDPAVTKVVWQSAEDILGPEFVHKSKRNSGSEDFSAYGKVAPLCYFVLGGGTAADGYQYANHSSKFVIDEASLINGVKTEVAATLNLLK